MFAFNLDHTHTNGCQFRHFRFVLCGNRWRYIWEIFYYIRCWYRLQPTTSLIIGPLTIDTQTIYAQHRCYFFSIREYSKKSLKKTHHFSVHLQLQSQSDQIRMSDWDRWDRVSEYGEKSERSSFRRTVCRSGRHYHRRHYCTWRRSVAHFPQCASYYVQVP